MAVYQVVVTSDEGAFVTDVTEEGAEWAVVVERQAQGTDSAAWYFHADGHVHGNAQIRVDRALQGLNLGAGFASLVLEQVNGVTSVVPQQVVGPGTGLTLGVGVGTTEEVGLNVHLLDVQFASLDLVVNPLVRRVETTGLTRHGHQTGALLYFNQLAGIFDVVGHRDFNHHVLASFQTLDGLGGVHGGWGSQQNAVYVVASQGFGQVGAVVWNATLFSNLLDHVRTGTNNGYHFCAFNVGYSIQVFLAESARSASNTKSHYSSPDRSLGTLQVPSE